MYDNLKESGLDPEQAIKDCAAEYKKREGFQRFYLSPEEAKELLELLDTLIVSTDIGMNFFVAVLSAVEHGGYYAAVDHQASQEVSSFSKIMAQQNLGWEFEHSSPGVKGIQSPKYRLRRSVS